MGKNRKHKKPKKLEFEDGQVLYDREWDLKFAEGPVLYDPGWDPSRIDGIDGKTMDNIKKYTAFALQVHNDTHMVKFSLDRLLLAAGDTGSMVDLKFTANPEPMTMNGVDINPRIFRARVSFTHDYVEFVEFLPAYLSNSSFQPPGQDKL